MLCETALRECILKYDYFCLLQQSEILVSVSLMFTYLGHLEEFDMFFSFVVSIV